MIRFDVQLNSTEPIYLQLIRRYKVMLAAGEIRDGDELPSRRELGLMLVINPNTVQRVYKELETEGLILTHNNMKSVAVVTPSICERIRTELTEEAAHQYKTALSALGYGAADAVEIIRRLWEK